MEIYNTLNRKKEIFTPINKNEVKMYCCGPTVHDFAHIGNFRARLFFDVLKRVFIFLGYDVKQVINITDVDDKTIKNSKKANMKLRDYTEMYTKFYMEDGNKLNITPAMVYPKATEHIAEMQKIIIGLLEKGYAYESEDGIYYDVSKFSDYGKLSGIELSGEVSRIKQDEYDKETASDFALWKKWDKEDGEVYWTGDLPKGRPGWHIECSAMSMKYLGETIDIHSGAVDLIFPHNENEIAQSEAYTGKRFVNYWAHLEHLLVNGQKMSKSLKNFYTIRDLEKFGFDPMSFRLMVIDHNYRTKLDFNFDGLKKYEKTLDGIEIDLATFKTLETLMHGKEDVSPILNALEKFRKGLEDDLNTHIALEAFFEVINVMNEKYSNGKLSKVFYTTALEAIEKMNSVLGILKDYEIPKKVIELAEKRKSLRKENAWDLADGVRKDILEEGFKIIDLKNSEYIILRNRKYGR